MVKISRSFIILLSILKSSKSNIKYLYNKFTFFSKVSIFSAFSQIFNIKSFSFNFISGNINSISMFDFILEILGIKNFNLANLSSILILTFSSSFSMLVIKSYTSIIVSNCLKYLFNL